MNIMLLKWKEPKLGSTAEVLQIINTLLQYTSCHRAHWSRSKAGLEWGMQLSGSLSCACDAAVSTGTAGAAVP